MPGNKRCCYLLLLECWKLKRMGSDISYKERSHNLLLRITTRYGFNLEFGIYPLASSMFFRNWYRSFMERIRSTTSMKFLPTCLRRALFTRVCT